MRMISCLTRSCATALVISACTPEQNPTQNSSAPALVITATYTATDLGTLPGFVESLANDINSAGEVVGWSMDGAGTTRAVLWENGTITDLGTLGGSSSFASGINSSGQIVGWSETEAGVPHAFLWENGVMNDLGTLKGSGESWASDINDLAEVVGASMARSGRGSIDQHAFRLKNGRITDLNLKCGVPNQAEAINSLGQIAGNCEATSGIQIGFFWDQGKMTDLGSFGGRHTLAYGINSLGQVVGFSEMPDGIVHGFIWQSGTMMDLGTLGGETSFALKINAQSQVVGSSQTEGGGVDGGDSHAFLWDEGTMIDLGTLGGTYSLARGITSTGNQIVGESWNAEGQLRATLWTRQ